MVGKLLCITATCAVQNQSFDILFFEVHNGFQVCQVLEQLIQVVFVRLQVVT